METPKVKMLIGRKERERMTINMTTLVLTRCQVSQRSRAGNLVLRPPGSVHQSGFGALKEGGAIFD